jgi:hypothetical protein
MRTRSLALRFVTLTGLVGPSLVASTEAQARAPMMRTIRPCDPKTAAYAVARAELEAIDAAIKKLAPAADFAALVGRIADLSRGPCFELMEPSSGQPTSALSLQTYWNAGGYSHLLGYLQLGKPAPILSEERNDPERDHSLTLLKVAEAGFSPGCPAAAPPLSLIDERPRLSAHRLDTDRTSLAQAARLVTEGWQEALAKQRACAH